MLGQAPALDAMSNNFCLRGGGRPEEIGRPRFPSHQQPPPPSDFARGSLCPPLRPATLPEDVVPTITEAHGSIMLGRRAWRPPHQAWPASRRCCPGSARWWLVQERRLIVELPGDVNPASLTASNLRSARGSAAARLFYSKAMGSRPGSPKW